MRAFTLCALSGTALGVGLQSKALKAYNIDPFADPDKCRYWEENGCYVDFCEGYAGCGGKDQPYPHCVQSESDLTCRDYCSSSDWISVPCPADQSGYEPHENWMTVEEYNDRCVIVQGAKCYDECKWRYTDCPSQDDKGDDQGDEYCVYHHENGFCYDNCDGGKNVPCPPSSSGDENYYSKGYIHECFVVNDLNTNKCFDHCTGDYTECTDQILEELLGADCYDCGSGYIFHNQACLYEGQGLSYNGDFDDMELCSGPNCEFYLSQDVKRDDKVLVNNTSGEVKRLDSDGVYFSCQELEENGWSLYSLGMAYRGVSNLKNETSTVQSTLLKYEVESDEKDYVRMNATIKSEQFLPD